MGESSEVYSKGKEGEAEPPFFSEVTEDEEYGSPRHHGLNQCSAGGDLAHPTLPESQMS